MSLFQCQVCGCCENTALSGQGCDGYAEDFYNWAGIEDKRGKKLCSACAPTTYSDGSKTEFGKWHGMFPQVFLPLGMFKTARNGNLAHIETGDEDFRKYAISVLPVPFQQRVQPWMLACFGAEISGDIIKRNHRFLEESLELVQSTGCTANEAHQLVDYVFSRPIGEKQQEVSGVMVTLAALCLASGMDMHDCGETELHRIWGCVEKIRAKQAAKPKHSPLPVRSTAAPGKETGND